MEVEPALSSVAREDFDCPVCHELLCEPCVPSCGHAFCKACLCKLLSHSSARAVGGAKCPVCRRVLHVTRGEDLAVCSQFDRLLALHFAGEHRVRREAAAALAAADAADAQARAVADGARERIPVFVMDATLPRQHLHLNVFEPRYISMVHRVLQGSRCFGMVGSANFGGMASHGVEVSIRECAEQWDGRFHLEAGGVGRSPPQGRIALGWA
ncbi:unnamed protein product [Prorocentrum cordatum]|uniref:RING-type domain-containing protein n=1 Tax=Prorocentrum cordatum TaxID=2364126 RepID=A0ABN9QWR2_9DINO|nr:unnamed protein product [Polarella glacialis]